MRLSSRTLKLIVASVLIGAASPSALAAQVRKPQTPGTQASPKIDACALLDAAEIQKQIGVAVEKGSERDARREPNGAYSSACVWLFKGENDLPAEQRNGPLGGRSFVILNAQRWPKDSEGPGTFLESFREASGEGVLPSAPSPRDFGDEALWWGDGLAVRKGDVSFGLSVFTPRDTAAHAKAPAGEREGRLAKVVLANLVIQNTSAASPSSSAGTQKSSAATHSSGVQNTSATAQGVSAAASPTNVAAGSVLQRGEYLVRAANCVSCHTTPGGQVFAGGVPFPTDFGTIYSTNITPDKATGIGAWTFEQFEAAMRSGVRPDGKHLYPAFPYTSFTKIDDADMRALYAYFMSLKPVNAPAKPNDMDFPFSQRWLLGPWKALFFDEGRFVPDKTRTEQWNRGAYLVEALAHCGACHSPRNMLGAEKSSAPYAGGVLEELDEERGPVRRGAPNLTSAAHGLAAWSEDDLAGYLKYGVGSRARLMGTMNEVVLNSTRHLTEADTRAMAVYLKSLPAAGDTGSRPSEKTMELGAKQYDIHCGTCHLPSGKGSEDTAPPLAGSALAQAPDPSSLIDLVINGPRVPVPAPSNEWQRPWQSMTPFGQKLSDEQAAALLTFVRNSWGNAAGVVESEDIDRLRY